MKFAFRIVAAGTLLQVAACAHTSPTEATDLVGIGYAETLDTQVMDALGLDVRFTARLRVTRVLRGMPPSSLLTIRYIAHTSRASDRESEFHLRRAADAPGSFAAAAAEEVTSAGDAM